MAAVSIAMKSNESSMDNLTELIWQDALRNLGITNNEVLLPINIADEIGQNNVNKIKARLCALLGAPVVSFVDESINAFRVMRTPAFSGTSISLVSHEKLFCSESPGARKKPQAAMAKSAKIPRPPNAFILYRQHHHPQVKEAYPDLSNNQISIILGKQWKAEHEDVKMHFKNMAEELKRKHAEDHPDYQYTPRKPSEKKRRTSSRQHLKPKSSSSPSSTNATPSDLTNTMYSEIQNWDTSVRGQIESPDDLNSIIDSNAFSEEPLDFDTNAFDTIFQQGNGSYEMSASFSQFDFNVRHLTESFEFPEFTTGCF